LFRKEASHHGGACPRQKIGARLAGGQLQGRAKGHRTQHWHRHHLALGHDALHVVDPGRYQHHGREPLRQVVQARLEGLRIFGEAARAFREHDQGVATLQRVHQGLQGIFIPLALALHIHRVKHLGGDPALER